MPTLSAGERRLTRLWALLAAAALAGCTLGPDYRRPEAPLPPAWRAPPVEPLAAEDIVNTDWWEAFGDPELNRLVRTALQANQDLQLAALRVQEFDARLQISRADELPQAVYRAGGKRQRLSEYRQVPLPLGTEPTSNEFEGSLNLGWELDLWGRVRRANEAARAQLLATEEARRAVMLSVVASVATSYLELLGLDRELVAVRESLANRERALALTDTKHKGGSATLLAVAEARQAVDALAATVPELERRIATFENALSLLLGQPPGAVSRRSIDALAPLAVPPGVPSDVLSRRPDVLAAEQELVAANARIGLAKAQYFPSLSLTGVLGHSSTELEDITKRSATFGEIGASLLGTLFDGGRIAGDIRQTEAVQRQMVVRYRQAVLTALREVEDALVARAKAGERRAVYERQVRNSEELLRLTQMRKDGGQSSMLDVLEAENYLVAAHNARAQSQRDELLSLIAIYKAMGGGWMRAHEAPAGAEIADASQAGTGAAPAGALQESKEKAQE